MARQLRIYFEGAWYHVMNRGINRQNIFFSNKQKYKFLKLLGEIKKIYGIEIHAYCLMSNHYHLIIHTPRANISDAMKYLNANYAKFVNFDMKRDGPLFKGRFKAIVISAYDYLIRLSRYIHLNPREANLVVSLSTYKWSSYPSYIGKAMTPEWLSTLEIINRFGELDFFVSYKKFVESDLIIDIPDYNQNSNLLPVLGSNEFRQMIDWYVKNRSLSAEIVGADRILVPPKISEIVRVVSQHFNLDEKHICDPSRGTKNCARRITIYICRDLGGYSLPEIAKVMGGISYKGVSNAICRIKSNVAEITIANKLIIQLRSGAKSISETKRNEDS